MKRVLLLTGVWLLTSFHSVAAGTNVPGYTFKFPGVAVFQALDIYKDVTGLKLQMSFQGLPNARIYMDTPALTKDEAIKLLEKTFKEQAGLIITRMDDKTARVTFDASVRTVKPNEEMSKGKEKFIVTAKDVNPKSIRVTGGPEMPQANLVFNFVGKTSDEIKALGHKYHWVQIEKDGVAVGIAGASLLFGRDKTNCVGLVLNFDDYKTAKLAETTLRGN